MAEHDEKIFEHELEEKLRRFDENLKIPEIPDAQSIFEKAESEKGKVLPFKKYSRYIAAAAAVVLICVSVPLISPALGSAAENIDQKLEAPKSIFGYATADMAEAETEIEPEALEEQEVLPEEPKTEEYFTDGTLPGNSSIELTNSSMESVDGFDEQKVQGQISQGKNIKKILEAFFEENDVELNPQIGPEEVFRAYSLAEKINKKRSIDVTVDEESVSVMLFDNSAGEEILCAFWMQGKYKESFYDGEKYIVKTYLRLSGDMVKADDYLPMFGNAESGTAFLTKEQIFVSEPITKGAMIVTAEIDVATGEYKIFAELI